jgi:hypothetical protein
MFDVAPDGHVIHLGQASDRLLLREDAEQLQIAPAGQISLANVLAVAQAATKSIVSLGDPQ